MNRDALEAMIAASPDRATFRAALEAHFRTADGVADLASAPRIQQGDNARAMTAADAVQALLEEFPAQR